MKLSGHQSSRFTKLLFIGDSGAGKTGGLAPLVVDDEDKGGGYELGILDMENGLDALKQWVAKANPKFLDRIDYETIRDPLTMKDSGPSINAKAFIEATKLMTKWSDGSDPAKWGPKKIFVLDSTTALGKAALAWAEKQTPAAKEPRTWYFAAQRAFENIIAMLTSEEFETNVIVIAHINRKELEDGSGMKHFPTSVGSALGPIIPRYFNTMVQIETIGTGTNAKKVIKTLPTNFLDLKNPAPFKISGEYGIAHGMAEVFKALRS